jgi:hypothetical protein
MSKEFTLSTLIPLELNKEFERACTDRNMKKKPAVGEALRNWIDGAGVEAAEFGLLSGKEYEYVVTLLRVLREREPRGLYQAFVGGLDAELLQHPVESPHERKKRKTGGNQRAG